jgi:hypothetical protein
MFRRALFVWLPFVALVGTLLSPSTSSAGPAEEASLHRALCASLYHLKAAREEIKDERFSRHREKVERDITVAIQEIEGALREGKIDPGFEPIKGWGDKYKSFRNLRQAVVELEIAHTNIPKVEAGWARKKELRQAIDDAYAHTKEALDEVK